MSPCGLTFDKTVNVHHAHLRLNKLLPVRRSDTNKKNGTIVVCNCYGGCISVRECYIWYRHGVNYYINRLIGFCNLKEIVRCKGLFRLDESDIVGFRQLREFLSN